jgi:hypothetical protein
MLKFFFTLILAILAFRLFGSFFGKIRGGGRQRSSVDGSPGRDAVDDTAYKDLTPYDIEDADYEDLPKQE